jgi:hypothetical protein
MHQFPTKGCAQGYLGRYRCRHDIRKSRADGDERIALLFYEDVDRGCNRESRHKKGVVTEESVRASLVGGLIDQRSGDMEERGGCRGRCRRSRWCHIHGLRMKGEQEGSRA